MSRNVKTVYAVSKSAFGIVSVLDVYKSKEEAEATAKQCNQRFSAYYYVTSVNYIK